MALGHATWQVYVAAGVIVGLIQCFLGYRIFRIVLGLTGFLMAAGFAGTMGFSLTGNEIMALIFGILGGLIGAGLMVAIYFVGLFLIGAFLGGVLGAAVAPLFTAMPDQGIVLVLGLVGGVLAVCFQRFMIILSTSFAGAWSAVMGAMLLLQGRPRPTGIDDLFTLAGSDSLVMAVCWILLGFLGLALQYRSLEASGRRLARGRYEGW